MVGADTTVPRNTVILPVKDGRLRTSLIFKVAEGPNDDGSWTAAAGGTDIDVFSNIGGARHNIDDGTEFLIDPPTMNDITSVVANGDFSDGADPTGWGAVKDGVVYEQLNDAALHIDLRRSTIKGFPAFIVGWVGSDPADGGTINTRSRAGHSLVIYREQFELSVVVNRAESEHTRRAEVMHILDEASGWLSTRKAVDGRRFASEEGIFVQRRYQRKGRDDLYKKFDVYGLLMTLKHAIRRKDQREYDDWLTTVVDITKPQDPLLPNQGDYTVVDDMTLDME
jgi:hypothetical protein